MVLPELVESCVRCSCRLFSSRNVFEFAVAHELRVLAEPGEHERDAGIRTSLAATTTARARAFAPEASPETDAST
jgi:hypothetical protein